MTDAGGFRVRRLRDQEVPAAVERALASFGATQDPQSAEQMLRRRVERGEVVVAADPGTDAPVAHAAISVVDHWLGGRRVPCQHISSVAVAPEDRGRGGATALVRALARQGAEAGAGLSLLFPSVDTLYRRQGWEHGGHRVAWLLPCRAANDVSGPPLRRLDPERDWPAVRECHLRFGAANPALPIREHDRWTQLRGTRFGWVRDAGPAIDAYVLLDHETKPGDWRHRLVLRDWAATSPPGLRAVVALLGRHGTTAVDARFHGPFPHPFALVVAEQELVVDDWMQWMARGLHLPTAIETRGFPPAVELEVVVEVVDELLEEQAGTWRLSVHQGRGVLVADRTQPTAKIDATGIGPLVTGHRSAEVLAAAGRIDGDEAALAALSTAFAGPSPHLTDFF